jgi:multidrug efflux pump subunit AcrA (membrane-fusion protein)
MNRTHSYIGLGLGVAALVGVSLWLGLREPPPAPPAHRPAMPTVVNLDTIERADLQPVVQLTGSVLAAQRSHLGFELAGRIASLALREGEACSAGQELARLDGLQQAAELRRAQAAAQLAERELELARAGTRGEQRARLEANLVVARAEAELASKEVVRGEELLAGGVISASQLDALIAQRSVAEGRVEAEHQALEEARAGTREEEIAIARAELELRRAELEAAQVALERTVLRAPYDGFVVARHAALGDAVDPAQEVFELVDAHAREIELELPSAAAARLPNALSAERAQRPRVVLRVDEQHALRIETRLDALAPVADPHSRNVRALVRLEAGEDALGVLRPGMFVRAELELQRIEDALLVATDALLVQPQGTVVVVAREASSASHDAARETAGASHDAALEASSASQDAARDAASASPVPSAAAANAPPALSADFVLVRVLGERAGRSAIEPVDASASLQAGDRVVVTGAAQCRPGSALAPRPPARGGESQ